ncbi:MAG: Unknown protein [uncultured Thiotrichaceae bacterium]|uniref:Methyltransferase type 11 domain-containing protein n=1 Tax=uncultured Thiotrichaceae bacterium TaxID=298394 RepID=A0A6S6SDE1_9GAMM|nr:MAG: Unknown protein [uncultured Thiotrichaceae bacterium]
MSDLYLDNILATLQWQSHDTQHSDITFINHANVTDDTLKRSTSSILAVLAAGETWQQNFAPGTMTPAWNADLVTQLDRWHFKTHPQLASIEPELGRFYPKKIICQGLEFDSNDLRPCHVIAIDTDSITLDCNHPLAKFALHLTLEQQDELAISKKPKDLVKAIIDTGPGLQARNPDAPVEFFKPEAFCRMDENSDTLFYAQPRIVSHLDETARAEIAKLYARFLKPGMKVLDLMSSWQSHLPDTIADLEVTGLGMNAEEVEANPQLTDYHIHDLNAESILPFDQDSFDLVICTASIEYLTQPLNIMEEIRRMLRSGQTFVVTFSERWFPPKAINAWSHLHPYEKLHFVANLFHQTHGFEQINTFSLRGLPRPTDDVYSQKLPFSDPVYAVWGQLS